MTPELSEQDQIIVDELCRALGGQTAVYRFGSSVDGTAHAGSDVDVAVLLPTRLEPAARFDLQERLATRLHRDVDLVDLAAASTVMAMQVVTTGRLLHDDAPGARGVFEDRTFSAYARLNEERRGILRRVAEEGTVYGG